MTKGTWNMEPKKLSDQQLLGERGISLIATKVAEMGFVWRPTATLDTGIDGEIELRDAVTGEMSGLILKVQSKAVSRFENETSEGFDYSPSRKDVDYWLKHNVPVILIVSRPSSSEAYWLPVRETSGQVRRLRFRYQKAQHRLDESAAAALLEYTRMSSPGARGYALRKTESLTSNLYPLTTLPPRLYLAETPHRTPKDVAKALEGHNISFEFALRNKRLLTPRDLTDPRYQFLCDRGTVEDFPTSEWAMSNDPDRQRDFVRILNQCLAQFLRTSTSRIRRDRQTSTYYFPSKQELQKAEDGKTSVGGMSRGYLGKKKATSREVVKALVNKKLGHVMGYRHAAMWAQFSRYNGQWHLEVTPTYRFTQPDGLKTSQYASEWLKGIKQLENNSALLGQLVMWEDILLNRNEDFFVEPYTFLGFGRLLTFELDRGLEDTAWTANDDSSTPSTEELPLGLFDALSISTSLMSRNSSLATAVDILIFVAVWSFSDH